MRPNLGEGGALVQLNNVAEAIKKQPSASKKKVDNIPSTQPSNPMAPVNTKPKRGRPQKVRILHSFELHTWH